MKSLFFKAFGVAMMTTILAGSWFGTAEASERVIVFLKDKNTWKQLQNQYNPSLEMDSRGFKKKSSQKIVVEDALANLNAIVVNINDPQALEALKNNPQVAMLEKEIFYAPPKPVSGVLDMSTAYAINAQKRRVRKARAGEMTPWGILAVKAPEAWSAGAQGQGVRVLVLDTGIDRDHVSLKTNFEKGKDFVGDRLKPYDYIDKVGHGTHVAGTIAAMADKSGFAGVAPQAKILAGRVCSEEGCSNISVARGIEWGIEEKVDVINMSLGGARSTPSERTAVKKANEAGITVVAAAGNDGTNLVGFPAALPTVIAVGALDSDLKKADFSQYGPELAVVAPGVQVMSAVPTGSGRESLVEIIVDNKKARVKSSFMLGGKESVDVIENELVHVGLGKPEDFEKVEVQGKFTLISRGEIKFIEKVQNALKAKSSGVIIYNNTDGLIRGALTEDGTMLPIPVVMIEQKVGLQLKSALEAGVVPRAAVATEVVDYSAMDGTSMAAPHVAGVVALMKSANKSLSPEQIKTILQETAKTLGPNSKNEYGAGLVNAEASVAKAKSTEGDLTLTPVKFAGSF